MVRKLINVARNYYGPHVGAVNGLLLGIEGFFGLGMPRDFFTDYYGQPYPAPMGFYGKDPESEMYQFRKRLRENGFKLDDNAS